MAKCLKMRCTEGEHLVKSWPCVAFPTSEVVSIYHMKPEQNVIEGSCTGQLKFM